MKNSNQPAHRDHHVSKSMHNSDHDDSTATSQPVRYGKLDFGAVANNLEVGSSHDPMEAEADRAAEKVMSGKAAGPMMGRPKPSTSAPLQRSANPASPAGGTVAPNVSQQIQQASGQGEALSGETRREMESSFGTPLDKVRVHTGDNASSLNQQVGAKAFTVGQDIFYGKNQFQPGTAAGKQLLAHELAHTVQQQGQAPMIQRTGIDVSAANKDDLGLAPSAGASAYLANIGTLKAHLAGMSATARAEFLRDFIGEFSTQFDVLYDEKIWEQLKGTQADEDAIAASANPIEGIDFSGKKTRYGDLSFHLDIHEEGEGLRILELRRSDEAAYLAALNTIAASADNTASLVMELRKIEYAVLRVSSAWNISQKFDVSLAEMLAFYRQEGNMTLAASTESLMNDHIPTGVSNSPTMIMIAYKWPNGDFARYWYDLSTMVLVVRQQAKLYRTAGSNQKRKELALGVYFNQIAGLDVVRQTYASSGITGLVNWSYDNRVDYWDYKDVPADQRTEDKASIRANWEAWRDSLTMTPVAKAGEDSVYVFTPANPDTLVEAVLTEGSWLHGNYTNTERLFGEGADMDFSHGVGYQFYNTTSLTNDARRKEVLTSAMKSAKSNGATDYPELVAELGSITSGNIGNWTKLKAWFMGARTNPGTRSRWDLVMNFMDTADKAEWSSWGEQRSNASLMMGLNTFFDTAFDPNERLWLKALDLLNNVDYVPGHEAVDKDAFVPKHKFYSKDISTIVAELEGRLAALADQETSPFTVTSSKGTDRYTITVTFNGETWTFDQLPIMRRGTEQAAGFSKVGNTYKATYVTAAELLNANNATYTQSTSEKERMLLIQNAADWGAIPALPLNIDDASGHVLFVPGADTNFESYTTLLDAIFTGTNSDMVADITAVVNYHTQPEGEGPDISSFPKSITVTYTPINYTFSDYAKGEGDFTRGSEASAGSVTFAVETRGPRRLMAFNEADWNLLDLPRNEKSLLQRLIPSYELTVLNADVLKSIEALPTDKEKTKARGALIKDATKKAWIAYKAEKKKDPNIEPFKKKDLEAMLMRVLGKVESKLINM